MGVGWPGEVRRPEDVLFSARLESFAAPEDPVAISALLELVTLRHPEQELLRSNNRYRMLVEGIADYAVYMLGPDGRIANWNRGRSGSRVCK